MLFATLPELGGQPAKGDAAHQHEDQQIDDVKLIDGPSPSPPRFERHPRDQENQDCDGHVRKETRRAPAVDPLGEIP